MPTWIKTNDRNPEKRLNCFVYVHTPLQGGYDYRTTKVWDGNEWEGVQMGEYVVSWLDESLSPSPEEIHRQTIDSLYNQIKATRCEFPAEIREVFHQAMNGLSAPKPKKQEKWKCPNCGAEPITPEEYIKEEECPETFISRGEEEPEECELLPNDMMHWLRFNEDDYSHIKAEQDAFRAGAIRMYWEVIRNIENPTRKSFVEFAYKTVDQRNALQEQLSSCQEELADYKKLFEKSQKSVDGLLDQLAKAQEEREAIPAKIIESVEHELKTAYGGLSKDENGKDLSTPYLVLGILKSAIDKNYPKQ